MKETLTQAVMAFKKTGDGWSDLSERLSLIVYRFPKNWTDWDEDRCSDFYISFLPKLPGLVQRFQPDFSFETYLSSSLRWFMKTFTENQAKREHYESWSTEISEAAAVRKSGLGSPPAYPRTISEDCPFNLDPDGRLKDPILRRRLLYAVLLRAADIDDHRIPEIAKLVDVDSEWLYEQTGRARSIVQTKIIRREELRQRRNECWYQLDGARKRIESACDSERRLQWEKRARTWKSRHQIACRNIRKLNIAPSHRDIGGLLEVPPGTISSGLHFLRKTWDSMEGWTRTGSSG